MGMHGDNAEVRKIKYSIIALNLKIKNIKEKIILLKHKKVNNGIMYLQIAKARLQQLNQERAILKSNLVSTYSKYR